jgi:tetratricopeptide (TPR) repeat protein
VATERDTEESLERLRAVVRANPRSTTFVALAHALCDAGRDEEAEEVCRQGLAQHPRLVTAQVALGRALLARKRLREAQEVLIDAAKSSPEHGDAFRWLGELVLERGHKARARPILEYAEELMPSDGRVSELLVKAGGQPQRRITAARPQTDFEHTRVGNARALAERMHEEPDTPATTVAAVTPAAEVKPGWGGVAAAKGAAASGPLARLRAAWRRQPAARRWLVAAGSVAIAAAALLVALLPDGPPAPPIAQGPAARPAPPPPRFDFLAAFAAGTLERLQAARAEGKRLAQDTTGRALDGDQLAGLALVDALLASEHNQGTGGEVEEAATAAARVQPATPARTARVAAARALAALAAGRLGQAKAAAEQAVAAGPQVPEALFAAGRVKLQAGELPGARRALEAALAGAPALVPAALDHSALLVDLGQPAPAVAALEKLVGQHPALLRARLLLAEARRASAVSVDADELREACKETGRESSMMRVLCAFDAAAGARLAGERGAALKAARSAVGGSGRNVRAVANGALMLATLGDIDGAAEALRKIRQETEPGYPPRAWAELAVSVGRGEKVEAPALDEIPGSPEARLLAARMSFKAGGPPALAEALRKLGEGNVAYDPDLRYFATLASEGKLGGDLQKEIRSRAEADKGGSSLAEYVLGRHALADGDRKLAARRLSGALEGHGDTCEAARLLAGIDRRHRPSSVNSDAKIARQVRTRNGGCGGIGK